jgi:hypothetical protein
MAAALAVFIPSAFANNLNQSGTIDGTTFTHENCTGTQDAGTILWHFIHTGTSSATPKPWTLTATFLLPDNSTVTETASGFTNGNSVVMYNITTPSTWKLLGGSNTSDTIVNDGNLNLSHTCVGPPRHTADDLTVSKTANTSYDRTFKWTIDKSADKSTVYSAGGGESGNVHYTIDVTKDAGTDSNFLVSGDITVLNPTTDPIEVDSVTDSLAGATVDCTPVTFPYDLPAGQSFTCTYSASVGSAAAGTNTATAHGPDDTSASGDAGYTFGAPSNVTNDEIDVTDPNSPDPQPYHFTDTGSVSYDKTYTDPAGTCTSHENTATITQTDQSDSVTVQDCQGSDLTVSKTATPSFTRTYAWDIKKDVDKTKVTLNSGQATFNYTVTVHHDAGTDSGWAVKGTITITNPNDWEDITLTKLADVLDSSGDCTLDTAGPYVVPMASGGTAGSLTVDYTCANASALDTKNTATATWDKDAAHTPDGSASGDAAVAFTTPTTVTDECVSVSDPIDPNSPHSFCVGDTGDPTFTFTYSRTVNAPALGSCQSYDNTATFTTNDTGKTGSASRTVTVCNFNAPLTIGYWKNHLAATGSTGCSGLPSGTSCSNNGPFAKTYLPQNLGGYNVNTILKAAQVFAANNCSNATTSNGNAINCLAAQLLAAELNIANSSDPSCISATITAANAFLTAIGYAGPGTGTLDATHTRAQAIALKTTLDNYNNFGC